jgi:hypothetical protein
MRVHRGHSVSPTGPVSRSTCPPASPSAPDIDRRSVILPLTLATTPTANAERTRHTHGSTEMMRADGRPINEEAGLCTPSLAICGSLREDYIDLNVTSIGSNRNHGCFDRASQHDIR